MGSKEVFSEIPVVWYVKHGELRINTKEGGVIVGKIEKHTIQMTLPAFGPRPLERPNRLDPPRHASRSGRGSL